MGVTSLPKELSPEELALQKHYIQLRKIKKQLQDLKASRKQEQQALATSGQATKRGHSDNAEEATEQAKKLLKAGAIKLEAGTKEKTFKRTVVKKAKESDRPTSMFQPFVSASESPEGYRPRGKPEFKNLYECFVSSNKAAAGSGESTTGSGAATAGAAPSKALYVAGSGLTEVVLRKAFNGYGAITSIAMEQGKSSGFVTLADGRLADEAVERLNGTLFMDVMLTVEVARRQPPPASRSASQSAAAAPPPPEKGAASWTELAERRSKNGSDSQLDQRALVTYDESDIFS